MARMFAPIRVVWCDASWLHWPNTTITVRDGGHYGRREAVAWSEENASSI